MTRPPAKARGPARRPPGPCPRMRRVRGVALRSAGPALRDGAEDAHVGLQAGCAHARPSRPGARTRVHPHAPARRSSVPGAFFRRSGQRLACGIANGGPSRETLNPKAANAWLRKEGCVAQWGQTEVVPGWKLNPDRRPPPPADAAMTVPKRWHRTLEGCVCVRGANCPVV